MMNYVAHVYNNIKYYYQGINPVLFSGAIDVIVVEQPDGSYRSTPFQVCFSLFSCMFTHEEKLISIQINEQTIDLKMRLGEDSVAHFVGEEDTNSRLHSLGLHYGSNTARFSVTTRIQGTAWCACNVYLMKWTDRLVISDIDGTITKSDVLGHIIPAIGGTWAHDSVAALYTRIKNNGYQMVYLSSRSIGQSHTTRAYLESVVQQSKKLPDGPVLLSPNSILMAFRKEVIERCPEEFKIACLTELKALFPDRQPFFAGFGNRPNDVASYLAVGIPLQSIFIINPSGVLSRADGVGFITNYASMATDMGDFFFPPISLHQEVDENSAPAYWNSLPEELTDEERREYYGIDSGVLDSSRACAVGDGIGGLGGVVGSPMSPLSSASGRGSIFGLSSPSPTAKKR